MKQNREVIIEVISRHEPVSDRMRDYATKKASKLARFNDRITKIEVIADHPHDTPEVEIIAHLRSAQPLVAKERAASFHATVDLLFEKMERQIKKDKEKRKSRKGDAGKGTTEEPPGSPPGGDEETYDDIVRKDLKS